jgi:threonyl-tRNA synthetase
MIKITFPDGSVREYNEGVTGLQIAESISSRLAQDVLACAVNGETIDLTRPINEDAEFVLYKWLYSHSLSKPKFHVHFLLA